MDTFADVEDLGHDFFFPSLPGIVCYSGPVPHWDLWTRCLVSLCLGYFALPVTHSQPKTPFGPPTSKMPASGDDSCDPTFEAPTVGT